MTTDGAARRTTFGRVWSAAAPFLSAVIVLVLGLVTYTSARRENDATALVTRTDDVLTENQAILSRMVDAETGERGFLITGDSAYLDPYHGAALEVNRRFLNLRV